jgi:hypothetical protein
MATNKTHAIREVTMSRAFLMRGREYGISREGINGPLMGLRSDRYVFHDRKLLADPMIPALARWNGDHAMTRDTTKEVASAAEGVLFDDWFAAIEKQLCWSE